MHSVHCYALQQPGWPSTLTPSARTASTVIAALRVRAEYSGATPSLSIPAINPMSKLVYSLRWGCVLIVLLMSQSVESPTEASTEQSSPSGWGRSCLPPT